MNKIPIQQLVIVEGKYDKITLENIIDATIIACNGFEIFKNEALQRSLRSMALKNGAIILTDSDSAGNMIRSHLQRILQGAEIHLLYTPAIPGKERRKTVYSKEGYLGVEGMDSEFLRRLFKEFKAEPIAMNIKTVDLFETGLTGLPGSTQFKEKFLNELELPRHLSNRALLRELNRRYTLEEFYEIIEKIKASNAIAFQAF